MVGSADLSPHSPRDSLIDWLRQLSLVFCSAYSTGLVVRSEFSSRHLGKPQA